MVGCSLGGWGGGVPRAWQGRFAVVRVGSDSTGRNAGSSNALPVLY